MYISNVIAVESGSGDGAGNFITDNIINTYNIAKRLQGCYGCNIKSSEIEELDKILCCN